MKVSFVILVAGNLLLMSVTALVGLLVTDSNEWGVRHVLLGVLTGLYTCLVQVVTYMYFVVCLKIVGQAVESGRTRAEVSERVAELKRRAFRYSAVGILAVLAAVGTGGAVEIVLPATVHLMIAFSAIIINAIVFILHFGIIERNRRVFDGAFPEAGDTAADL